MKLIALMPVRNEDWGLGLTLRAALMWVDEVIVLLHACTDESSSIARRVSVESGGRVVVCSQFDPIWAEMSHRQQLLHIARTRGATHIALIDADEILSGNLLTRNLMPHAGVGTILQLPMACLARGIGRYYTSGIWYNNWVTTMFQDTPEAHWQSETRGGYDFHHRHPFGVPLSFYRPIAQSEGGLMHLQFLDERRLRAKQALYKMTERLRWPDKHSPEQVNNLYNPAVYQSDPTRVGTAEVPESWWAPYKDLLQHLHADSEPWQEAECKRLWAEHDTQTFAGLDLFGVV